MKFNNISGVILAGGSNSRFDGKVKANLLINGRTIISIEAGILRNIFSEIIIVTNTPGEFNEFSGYKIVSDFFKLAGPLGGIHAAMKASSCDAVFVFAADMPFLNEKIIIRQAEYFQKNRCEVLVPSVNQKIEPLHAIYSISVSKKIEEYLSAGTGNAVWKFINKTDVRFFEFDDAEETRRAFMNINTPEDILIVEEILRSRG